MAVYFISSPSGRTDKRAAMPIGFAKDMAALLFMKVYYFNLLPVRHSAI